MEDDILEKQEDGSCMHGYRTVHFKAETWLQERRLAMGLTQKEVAEKAGISQQLYQYFESGKRKLMTSSFRTTCKVLEAMEYDITEFYHDGFVFGEKVYLDAEGVERFERNGKRVYPLPGQIDSHDEQ